MATSEQMDTIQHRRIDDVARAMMRYGVELSWEQADEIGDSGCQWIRDRLGLRRTTDDRGVRYEVDRCVVTPGCAADHDDDDDDDDLERAGDPGRERFNSDGGL